MTKVVEYIKRVKVKYKMPFNANGKLRDDERSTKHNLKPTLLLFIASSISSTLAFKYDLLLLQK